MYTLYSFAPCSILVCGTSIMSFCDSDRMVVMLTILGRIFSQVLAVESIEECMEGSLRIPRIYSGLFYGLQLTV
jgi:hypothetical protein